MANQGELQFTLPKIDDLTAFELVKSVRDLFEVTEDISIKLAHGIRIGSHAYREENILPSDFKIQEMQFNGPSKRTGHSIVFVFMRYPVGKPDFHPDLRSDYASLTLGGDSNYWRENPELAIEASSIVSRLTTPSTGSGGGDESEIFRQLIIGHDSTHRRMLSELNQSLEELSKRRAQLEEEATKAEIERRAAHEKAFAEIAEEKAALERQSHMTTRRKISQTIHRVMTDPSKATSVRTRSSYFAVLVFFAYFGLGAAGAFGTYLTFLSLDGLTSLTNNPVAELSVPNPDGETLSAPFSDHSSMPNSSMTTITWFLMVKFVFSSIVTVFGLVSAATWLRRHLENENRFAEDRLAFIADVERASWVIEAIHEVKHEAKGELPKEWVDAVTRNLFAPKNTALDLDESANALRALIGLAGSAKVGPQGLEMEFNKKGTKALGES